MQDELPEDINVPLGLFDFLDIVREERITSEWHKVLELLRSDDLILAMEAEQVLKELLPHLPRKIQELLERELQLFMAKISMALSNSML